MSIAKDLRQQITNKEKEKRDFEKRLEKDNKIRHELMVAREKPFAWQVALAKIKDQQDKVLLGQSSSCDVSIEGKLYHKIDGVNHTIYDEHLEDLRLLFIEENFVVTDIQHIPYFASGYENGDYVPSGGGYSYFNVKW